MQSCFRTDLHIHSTFSDANWDYKQVITESIKNGLELISITDHDVVSNMALLQENCEHIAFLTGVEFSASLDGNLFHILGYGFDWRNHDINSFMQRNLSLEAANNKLRDDTCIKSLMQVGHRIDWDEYTAYENGPEATPGKQFRSKAIDFLIHIHLCKDRKDFFERLYVGGTPIGFPIFPHPSEAIEAIKTAGGIPVLAHPVHRHNKLSLSETLELFYNLSIGGIECIRLDYDKEITDICCDWCRENNLLITGGSDCHGTRHRERKIGEPIITTDELSLGALMDKIIIC